MTYYENLDRLERQDPGWYGAESPSREADPEPFDTVDFISRFEAGELADTDELVDGFQHLVDTGVAWQLQGVYGRTAQALIDEGLVTR